MKTHSTLLLATVTLFTATSIRAQEKTQYKPDHRFAFSPITVSQGDVAVEISDALAEATWCKFKFKVTNKGADYVFVDPSKFKMTMGGTPVGFTEKPFMVRPFNDASRTLNVMGGSNYHHEAFTIDFADGFTTALSKGTTVAMEEFTLPAAKNEVSTGPFTVNLKKLDKETNKTTARFSVKYSGKAIGIVDASKVGVRIPAGQVFANSKSKSKPSLLDGGETDDFEVVAEIPGKVVDMQFAILTLIWNDAFTETSKTPFSIGVANFVADAERTKKVN